MTILLLAVLMATAGFLGGVLTEKQQLPAAASAAGTRSSGEGSGGSAGSGGASAAAAANAIVGQILTVSGTTLYVTDIRKHNQGDHVRRIADHKDSHRQRPRRAPARQRRDPRHRWRQRHRRRHHDPRLRHRRGRLVRRTWRAAARQAPARPRPERGPEVRQQGQLTQALHRRTQTPPAPPRPTEPGRIHAAAGRHHGLPPEGRHRGRDHARRQDRLGWLPTVVAVPQCSSRC